MPNPEENQNSNIPIPNPFYNLGTFINGGPLFTGYRFCPDDRLLMDLLRLKCSPDPFPPQYSALIPVCNVYMSSPWNLPGDRKYKRFFFSNRSENMMHRRFFRAGIGCWRSSAHDDRLVHFGQNVIVMKKTLEFYTFPEIETRWVMHQFYLIEDTQIHFVPRGDWIVSHVYEKEVSHDPSASFPGSISGASSTDDDAEEVTSRPAADMS